MRRWGLITTITVALGALLFFLPGPDTSHAPGEHGRIGPHGSAGTGPSPSNRSAGDAGASARLAPASSEPDPAADVEQGVDAPGTLSLWGTVTDAHGQPLAGVQVQARPGPSVAGGARGYGKTDARGRFRLRSLAPGTYDVYFERERFEPQRAAAYPLVPGATPLAIVLQPAPTLSGRVVDPQGQPVPGATVDLYWIPIEGDPLTAFGSPLGELLDDESEGESEDASEDEELEPVLESNTRSGPDGTFALDTPRTGAWLLQARAEGFAELSREVLSPSRDVWLVLGAGASVEVQVVDEQDRPVSQARLALWSEAKRAPFITAEAVADEAGRAALRGVEAGTYVLSATSPTGMALRLVTRPLVLRANQAQRVRLKFEEGRRLSGRVVDQQGQPVPDVWVRVLPSRRSTEPAAEAYRRFDERLSSEFTDARGGTRSGPDGRFTVRHLHPIPYELHIDKPGYLLDAPLQSDILPLEEAHWLPLSASQTEVRVVLRYGGRVLGRVVRADGEPVTEFWLNTQAFSHPAGTFVLPAGEPGPRELEVLVPRVGGLKRTYEVREGEDVDLGDLVVGEGRAVRVRVEDVATSRPLAYAQLEVREASEERVLPPLELGLPRVGETNRDGTFVLPDVPARPLRLSVSVKGYEPAQVQLGAEAAEATLRLRPWATLQGRVRVAGTPLSEGTLRFFTPQGEKRMEELEVTGGVYSGHLIPPGRYAVQVDCQDCGAPPPVFALQWMEVPGPQESLTRDFEDTRGGATLEVQGDAGLGWIALVTGAFPPVKDELPFLNALRLQHPREELGDHRYRWRHVPAGRHTLLGHRGLGDDVVYLHYEVEVPAEGVVHFPLPPP